MPIDARVNQCYASARRSSVSHLRRFARSSPGVCPIGLRSGWPRPQLRALRDADFELGSGKSVSWYVEPPPTLLEAKAHAEMRREEAGDEPDDTEWRRLAGENDTRRDDTR